MKNFQLFAVVILAILSSNQLVAQCDAIPLLVDQSDIDITLDFETFGYCPDNDDVVDIADSGDPFNNITGLPWIESGNNSNADCDPTTAAFLTPTFTDTHNPGTCPEIIEREWTVTYDDAQGESITFIQFITLTDDTAPEITTCPPDITLELTDACDETDSNVEVVTGFVWSSAQVQITQSCETGFKRALDIERTWTLEDECGNISDECEQNVLIFDNTPPTIISCPGNGVPIEIELNQTDVCDETNPEIEAQSGFPYDPGPVILTEAEFSL